MNNLAQPGCLGIYSECGLVGAEFEGTRRIMPFIVRETFRSH
jgi:hypothetical protein